MDDQLDILNALTGPAAEIVDEVAETGTLTYATLNAALMRVYGAKKAHDELEREFQAVKQENNETPRAFAPRIDRFLLGLQDRAQATMLNVTNADTLCSAIVQSRAFVYVCVIIVVKCIYRLRFLFHLLLFHYVSRPLPLNTLAFVFDQLFDFLPILEAAP